MQFRWTALVTSIVFAAIAVPCAGQGSTIPYQGTGTPGQDAPPPTVGNDNDIGVNQIQQFGNYDALKRRIKQANPSKKSLAELLAEDKANAVALVAASKLSCTVSDAVLVAEDATAHTKTYEVACENGTGYFLVQSEPPAAPSGFSCFAADAAKQADIAAHRQPAVACGLPANADPKAMAGRILSRAGKICDPRDYKWLGQNSKSNTDFLEVACLDGNGYIVRSPLPGSQAPVRIETCIESGRNGLPCRMTESDPVIIAARNALKQHNVPCDAESVHAIGHETIKRRQVVEFFCPAQQPNGLVAFIPAEGSTAPFETLDCKAAKQHQAVCTLTKQN